MAIRSRSISRVLGVKAAALVVLLMASTASIYVEGCADNCDVHSCSEFDGATNQKTFTKCYYGISPMETVIEDEAGNEIYDCTDGATETCTGATVDAEFAYCEVM